MALDVCPVFVLTTVASFAAAVLPVADTDHSKSTMCTRDMSLDSLHSSMDSLATHDAPSTSAQVPHLTDAEHLLVIVPILCWCRILVDLNACAHACLCFALVYQFLCAARSPCRSLACHITELEVP